MEIYASLGVPRVINAQGRLTRLGGSRMPPAVLEAMSAATGAYVDMFELQRAVGRRLAELTHNEAAYVCTGAATGLFLTTLACMTRGRQEALAALPEIDGLQDEVVIHHAHRFTYDPAVRLTRACFVEIGTKDATELWELEEAITPRTAAVLYVAGGHFSHGALALEDVIDVAHAHDVPVIVDAAAQLPPAANLWHYTRDLGADLAIFSGGKDLRGPQSSGLIVGKADLIEACFSAGTPHPYIGRPMKVGKEEMLGLLAAVELYLADDHATRDIRFEDIVAGWVREFDGLPGVHARRDFPNEAGQPVPRCLIEIDAALSGLDGNAVRWRLWDGEPRIAVQNAGALGLHVTADAVDPDPRGLYLTPDCLEPGEEHVVTERLREILGISLPGPHSETQPHPPTPSPIERGSEWSGTER
jgi:L-seryl-tRNA(Ser) seleniumtransferase